MANRVEGQHVAGYDRSEQDHSYEYDSGVVVLPIARRTTGHRIIRLHGGVGKRIVRWDSARRGNPPIVPTMADTSGDTFIHGSITPSLPAPSDDARGYDWRVRGEYVFVQNVPRISGTHAFPVGQHPFVCPDQAAQARANSAGAGQAYTDAVAAQEDPVQAAVQTVQGAVRINRDGSYTWAFLALPAIFASDHILQD